MSVPLTVINLEIADDSPLPDFAYQVKRERIPPSVNSVQETTSRPELPQDPLVYKGRRKFFPITIETYMATKAPEKPSSSLFDTSTEGHALAKEGQDKAEHESDAEAQAPVNVTKSRTFAEVTQGQEKDSKVSEERKTSSLFEGSVEERGTKASHQATKKKEHTISGALKQQLHKSHSIDHSSGVSPRDRNPKVSPRGKSPANEQTTFGSGSLDLEDRASFTPINLDLEEAKSRAAGKVHSPTPDALTFFSGNPSVETTEGIIHLYKENELTSLEGEDSKRGSLMCMLNVPTTLTSQDLIQLIGPVERWIEHVKIIRDGKPNHYMVLVKFCEEKYADEFYKNFNGKPYNSIEPEVCYLVYVAKLESIKESSGAGFPIPGATELPTCPVCLERMDESVNGILTILCNHSFHTTCLAHWDDSSCPVCRYTQTPESVADNKCFECASDESLWICLICGYVGCGRYVQGHAFTHFQETNHTYSMQLGSNRVWDYAGDNYVHRLVQNKSDGKMVQVGESGIPEEGDDKLDAITLEYTYLLNTQLEAQRHYFEARLDLVEKEALNQLGESECRVRQMLDKCGEMEAAMSSAQKEQSALDKKYNEVTSRFSKTLRTLSDEQEMNKFLRENQSGWQKQVDALQERLKEKDSEVGDLRDQLRDVMMHLGARDQLTATARVSQEEIQEVGDLRDQLRDVMMHLGARDQLTATARVSQEEIQESTVTVGAAAKKHRKKAR